MAQPTETRQNNGIQEQDISKIGFFGRHVVKVGEFDIRSLIILPGNLRIIYTTGRQDLVLAPLADLQQGQRLGGHTADIWDLKLSSQLGVVASCSGNSKSSDDRDCSIRLWDAGTGSEIRVLTRGSAAFSSVCFLPDKQHLASRNLDGLVQIWNLSTGKEESRFECKDPEPNTRPIRIAVSPDGRKLFVGLFRLHVIDLQSSAISILEDHEIPGYRRKDSWIYDVAPLDNQSVIVARSDYGFDSRDRPYGRTIVVWDIQEGTITRVLPIGPLEHICALRLALGNRILWAAAKQLEWIDQSRSGAKWSSMVYHPTKYYGYSRFSCLDVASDDSILVAGTCNGEIVVGVATGSTKPLAAPNEAKAVNKKIHFHCPKCSKAINAPENLSGKRGKCPGCNTTVDIPPVSDSHPHKQLAPVVNSGYGLSLHNPVLCGGGVAGEQEYLAKLRCPAGKSVKYKRRGSKVTEAADFLKVPGVRWFPGRQAIAMGITPQSVLPINIDVYDVECLCGKHNLIVYMAMYHRGQDNATLAVESTGWTHEGW